MSADKPLTGFLAHRNLKDPNVIGDYFGTGVRGGPLTGTHTRQLDSAGIAYHILTTDAVLESGKRVPVPVGYEVTGPSNISSFVYLGGTYVVADSLNGIAFETKPGKPGLYYSGPHINRLREQFEGQGIRFTHEGQGLVIEDETAKAAIALSGGRFSGSQGYFSKMKVR